jgi:putative peptidoglycan lipid II flippase
MNLLFVGPLAHAGLALAIGLGACLNALLLYGVLRRQRIYVPQPGWGLFAAKVAISVLLMAAALRAASGPAQWWFEAGAPMRVAALAGLVSLGAAVYLGALFAFGFRLRDFSRRGAE